MLTPEFWFCLFFQFPPGYADTCCGRGILSGICFIWNLVVCSLSSTEYSDRRPDVMRLLLTNCPECHAVMIRNTERDVCKACFERRYRMEDAGNSDASTGEKSGEQVSRCRRCGREVDSADVFCLRCTLKLARMSKDSVSALQGKLERFPVLRGKNRPFIEASRSHVQDVIPSRRRQSKKRSSFTPGTKYSA